ncbi:MAG: zf-HC2 domain-containing protein, partial [Elusimicrobia bacterium]|nr:zf-HC2 domain-containing protein [Elusimicrobiota bacterium]
DCEKIKESLPAFQDGEPAAIPAAEIEAHLAGCAPCRAEAEALEQAWTLFKSQYPAGELPALISGTLRSAAGTRLRRRRGGDAGVLLPRPRRLRWGMALLWTGAAAALALALVLPARKKTADQAYAGKRAPLELEGALLPASAEWSLTRRRAPEKFALAWAREIGGAPE